VGREEREGGGIAEGEGGIERLRKRQEVVGGGTGLEEG